MANNEQYRTYCDTHRADVPLFYQDWWLDAAVGPDRWQGLVSASTFEDKAAIMPVVATRKWGLPTIRRPPLTTYQGPWWAGFQNLATGQQVALIQQLWPELIDQLPQVSHFHQTLFPGLTYAFPFQERGYQLGVRYTYTLDLRPPAAQIFQNFRRDVQRKIRQYGPDSEVVTSTDLASFLPLAEAVYARQGLPLPYRQATLTALFQAAYQRQQARLFVLHHRTEGLVGGLVVFFDAERVYLLQSGISAAGRKTGAFQVLVWAALQHFGPSHQVFDFCGSMIPGIADRNRSLGAVVEVFLEVRKRKKILKLIQSL
ncbi:MAG: hypothetical protein DA408_11260 [Bacteroidetes bacterium]|nr:MAG: hypothetical protein C7N36_14165 [Bacteroidota bacterium]PTM12253.1 MAG: hypothetical protein DA408_11260 [Bacteroidota bacterium]